MTLDEILSEMRRGCCSAHKVATEGCSTCEPTMRAIEAVKARFALPVIETCEGCSHCSPQVPAVCCHPRRRGTKLNSDGSCPPPDWCPLRGTP